MSTSTLYSADEVATLLRLHVRTVRNYVRDGRLRAVRIGKQYRIAREDVDRLTGGRATPSMPEQAANDRRIEVTALLQLEGIDAETATRVSALVGGAAAARTDGADRLHTQTVYDPQRQSVRVVAIGSPETTASLIGLVGTLMGAKA